MLQPAYKWLKQRSHEAHVSARAEAAACGERYLVCTPNVAALLRDGKTSMLAGLLDREPGMQSTDRCLLALATRSVIEGREAHARAVDKRAFAAWG